ncbi:hypothetical protein [Flavobacterium xanthum]|uniref:Uncharacterized protein n=1 Tax=Flavobacterium xanthum TaxID=69322 RepID=A0A1M7LMQ3_9FLAO|nr:hypothetical protein [Flavobacterium xanthum]SHM79454.1 hypothetical protein SAMN05443669_10767 [Flavobacterium xanthum]
MEDKILFSILLIIVIAFILLFFKMNNGIGTFNLKIFGITFIASLGTILALSNIPQSNMTAIFGILGAIIGYLFGLKVLKNEMNKKTTGNS